MNQKGFAAFAVIIVLLILTIVGGGAFYLQTQSSKNKISTAEVVEPETSPKNFGSLLRQPAGKKTEVSVENSRVGLIQLPKVQDPQIGEVGAWSKLPPELSFFKEVGNEKDFPWFPTSSTLLTRITPEDTNILENKKILYALLPNTDQDVADFNELFSITNNITSYLENYYDRPENYVPVRNQGHYPFTQKLIYSADYNPNMEANLILQQANVSLTPEQISKIKDNIYYRTDGAATNAYFAFNIPLDINRNGQEDDYLMWEGSCGWESGKGHYINQLPVELKRLEPGYPLDDPNFNEEEFNKWYFKYCFIDFPL